MLSSIENLLRAIAIIVSDFERASECFVVLREVVSSVHVHPFTRLSALMNSELLHMLCTEARAEAAQTCTYSTVYADAVIYSYTRGPSL